MAYPHKTVHQWSLLNKIRDISLSNNKGILLAILLIYKIINKKRTDLTQIIANIIIYIAEIDSRISKQLSAIIQDKKFKKLESDWVSLQYMVLLPINPSKCKVKIFDMAWNELAVDILQSYSIHKTQLYNKIGNNELNVLGGEPFGCIGISHYISLDINDEYDTDDIYIVELLAQLGNELLCPFILSINDDFLGGSSMQWLSDLSRIAKIYQSDEYDVWHKLREKEWAKFISLVFPKRIIRETYSNNKAGFIFNEEGTCVYANSIYLFLTTLLMEFQRVNWFGLLKLRVKRSQGAVINQDDKDKKLPQLFINPKFTQKFTDKMAMFYANMGFTPVAKNYLTDIYYFYGNNSIFESKGETAQKIKSQIQITLIGCRIAHYLKAQSRNIIATTKSVEECEQYLKKWIDKYTSNLATDDDVMLAKYPLSYADVNVEKSKLDPNNYHCVLRILPQYHTDKFSIEITIKTKLSEGRIS